MAKRGHYSFEKRQKELKRAEKKRKKLERRQGKSQDEVDGAAPEGADAPTDDETAPDAPEDEVGEAVPDPGNAS